MTRKLQNITQSKGPATLTILLLLVGWQLVAMSGLVPGYLLPSPVQVLHAFCQDWNTLWSHLLVTLQEALLGLVVGVSVGFVFAMVMDAWEGLYRACYPLLIISQTIPTVAIAPLLVLWFGYDMTPKVILVVLVTFFPVTVGLLEGFRATYKIIDTADYGVPQFRRRFVLLGSRYKRHPITLPDTTHAAPNENERQNKLPWNTVRTAFDGIPALLNGDTDPNIPLHTCSRIGELNMQRIRSVPHDGGSRSSFPPDLVLKCHRDYPDGFRDVYGRMHWDQPSPTLTGGCTNITRGRYVHPDQDRGISLYEAARLQTFPDDYRFAGNFGEKALQIGNAVPVHLAQTMGIRIIECLNEINGQA